MRSRQTGGRVTFTDAMDGDALRMQNIIARPLHYVWSRCHPLLTMATWPMHTPASTMGSSSSTEQSESVSYSEGARGGGRRPAVVRAGIAHLRDFVSRERSDSRCEVDGVVGRCEVGGVVGRTVRRTAAHTSHPTGSLTASGRMDEDCSEIWSEIWSEGVSRARSLSLGARVVDEVSDQSTSP